jgi:Asp-tRNA(Asn)/Glu-tRNA(Gln) amidotransferase A subunit family amidase
VQQQIGIEPPSQPPRIAIYRGPDWTKVEASTEICLEETARRLAKAGATITEVGTPQILRDALDAHYHIVIYELARALAYEWLTFADKISPVLAGMIKAGFDCPFDRFLAAQRVATAAREWIAGAFVDVDLWMTVSAHGEAPEGLANTGDPVMNRLWSLLHVPVVTVPAGQGPRGLPLGVQLIGPLQGDAGLTRAPRWIEQHLGSMMFAAVTARCFTLSVKRESGR